MKIQQHIILTTLVCTMTSLAHAASIRKLPHGLTACSKYDPHLNSCATRNARAAIPYVIKGLSTLGLGPMDPLHITQFSIDDSSSNRQVALDLAMQDTDIMGLRDMTIDAVEVNLEKGIMSWRGTVPRTEIIGHYSVSGRVLVLPIRGNGPMNITLGGVVFNYTFKIEPSEKREGYVVPRDNKLDFTPASCNIMLDNLFGDKALSDQMNVFLNENWHELIIDLGPAIGEILNTATNQVVKSIMNKVPYNQIFTDKPVE